LVRACASAPHKRRAALRPRAIPDEPESPERKSRAGGIAGDDDLRSRAASVQVESLSAITERIKLL
jgi:hypothetical protein